MMSGVDGCLLFPGAENLVCRNSVRKTARVYSKVLAIWCSNYQQYVRPNVSDCLNTYLYMYSLDFCRSRERYRGKKTFSTDIVES